MGNLWDVAASWLLKLLSVVAQEEVQMEGKVLWDQMATDI